MNSMQKEHPRERRLSEVASILKQPEGMLSSDFPRIELVANRMDIHWDLWQRGLLWILFSRGSDGKYACGNGGLTVSSPRQIGKTFTIGTAFFVECMLRPKLNVIWTAHHTRTTTKTFADMEALAGMPAVARHVAYVRKANGQQEIGFTNGSVIMFGAREKGFGRGLHGVDVEVFDEAQILSENAIANMVPAMNTAQDPLVVFMGNPPKPGDPCEVFAGKRAGALDGSLDGGCYIELAADRDADVDDRAAWAKANPSYPSRTKETAIVRLRQLLDVDAFKREALGIWDEAKTDRAIPEELWSAGAVDAAPAVFDRLAVGIDMPPTRESLTLCACWKHGDAAHVETIEIRDVASHGMAWVVDWCAARWRDKLAAVMIDAQSPAMALLPDFKAAHVRVTITGANDIGRATGRFMDMLKAGKLTHLPDDRQEALAAAVKGATTRPIGRAGAFGWDRSATDIDISPLVASTIALYGACTTTRNPRRHQKVRIGG